MEKIKTSIKKYKTEKALGINFIPAEGFKIMEPDTFKIIHMSCNKR